MDSKSLTMIDLTSSIKHQVAGNKTINKQPNIAIIQFKNQLEIENNSSCSTPGIIMKSKNYPFVNFFEKSFEVWASGKQK